MFSVSCLLTEVFIARYVRTLICQHFCVRNNRKTGIVDESFFGKTSVDRYLGSIDRYDMSLIVSDNCEKFISLLNTGAAVHRCFLTSERQIQKIS